MAAKKRRYKKLLTTSTPYPKPHSQITFYLERSLGAGKIIISELREAGVAIEPHFKWFRHDTPDEEWLSFVGKKRWIVLKRDKMIGRRLLELDALLDAGVKSFVLVSGQLKDSENAAIFIAALPKIEEMVAGCNFPFIAKVYKDGSVKLWKTDPMIHKGVQKKKVRREK